jgi:hypothetical protein
MATVDSEAQALRAAVASYLRHPDPDGFGALALRAARLQARKIPACARLWASRGVDPEQAEDWRAIPPMPTLAFKRQPLAVGPAVVTFRSSGTRSGRRSEHHQPWPELYDLAVDLTFPTAALPPSAPTPLTSPPNPGSRAPMLSLIAPPRVIPDSSLSHMIGRVVATWGASSSAWALGEHGLDLAIAESWISEVIAAGRPALILSTAFALVYLLDELTSRRRAWALPAGSLLFETGGYKGRSRSLDRRDIEALVNAHLGLAPHQIVREYGMSELSSQLYASARTGSSTAFTAPPWVRVQILDPATLAPLDPDREGLISIVDLANAGSIVHVLTEDLGRLDREGRLTLLGRASDAELRGCSLAAEELLGEPWG